MYKKEYFFQLQERTFGNENFIRVTSELVKVTSCYRCANCDFQKIGQDEVDTECVAICKKNGANVTDNHDNIAENCPEI